MTVPTPCYVIVDQHYHIVGAVASMSEAEDYIEMMPGDFYIMEGIAFMKGSNVVTVSSDNTDS